MQHRDASKCGALDELVLPYGAVRSVRDRQGPALGTYHRCLLICKRQSVLACVPCHRDGALGNLTSTGRGPPGLDSKSSNGNVVRPTRGAQGSPFCAVLPWCTRVYPLLQLEATAFWHVELHPGGVATRSLLVPATLVRKRQGSLGYSQGRALPWRPRLLGSGEQRTSPGWAHLASGAISQA